MPSVLWRCWLGDRKGIRPVKNEWWGVGVVVCLERGADLHMAQLMPLPLTVSCFGKIQIGFTFLVPAYPGYPGKEAVKWLLLLLFYSPRLEVNSIFFWNTEYAYGVKIVLSIKMSILLSRETWCDTARNQVGTVIGIFYLFNITNKGPEGHTWRWILKGVSHVEFQTVSLKSVIRFSK